jgi:hypothetical protein
VGSANATTAAPAASHTVQVPYCYKLVTEPSMIPLTCADGRTYVENVHWHTHTTATGTVVYTDSKAHAHKYRANVHVFAPTTGSKPYYTRLTASFPSGGPGGKPSTTYALHLNNA